MFAKFDEWGPVTTLLVGIVLVMTIAGAVVTVVNPQALSFAELLDKLEEFLIALGILGVARGAKIGMERMGSGGDADLSQHPDYEAEPVSTDADEGMGADDEESLAGNGPVEEGR